MKVDSQKHCVFGCAAVVAIPEDDRKKGNFEQPPDREAMGQIVDFESFQAMKKNRAKMMTNQNLVLVANHLELTQTLMRSFGLKSWVTQIEYLLPMNAGLEIVKTRGLHLLVWSCNLKNYSIRF